MKAKDILKKPTILILEDDNLCLYTLSELLRDYQIKVAENSKKALQMLKDESFELVFIDLDLDYQKEGIDFLKEIKNKNIYKVLLTGRDEEEIIREGYSLGANDYVTKPLSELELNEIVKRFFKWFHEHHKSDFFKKLYPTNSKKLIEDVLNLKVAMTEKKTSLIHGETGVGKSHLVSAIHKYLFKNSPFVEINCASLPNELLESELFGYAEGAFTGAKKAKKGLLELADKGIVFLDEINSLHLSLQGKVLKALEEKSFYPLGSDKAVQSDFILVCATNESIPQMIKEKRFREDLYYRINDIEINITPLCERREDIDYHLNESHKNFPRKIIIESDAKEEILNYRWPGNLRQFYKTMEKIKNFKHSIITKADIIGLIKSAPLIEDYINLKKDVDRNLSTIIETIERDIVMRTLHNNGNKVRDTLRELGISQSTYYRITKENK